ncbi:HU family DNA-binding protein [Anianabacter salinae]|uniref:HU family DNA-binding protein n=1 Tax=Anianabacter salinae TaxID=2851023 RepID=UPI00225E44AE|nr:HU family DNA-binding protein [Anianabacter salinae]MBV0914109.1 HU family DNA-binding protein [Anianabacter salinae]
MAKAAETPTTPRRPRRARAAADTPVPSVDSIAEAAASLGDEAAPEDATADDTELKKPELIRRVVAASGLKKKDVKPVVEALLKELGDALSNGEAMNLQPLGKLQINRTKDKDNGEVIIVKVRRNQQAVDETVPLDEKKPDDPLAEAAE